MAEANTSGTLDRRLNLEQLINLHRVRTKNTLSVNNRISFSI